MTKNAEQNLNYRQAKRGGDKKKKESNIQEILFELIN